MISNYDIIVAKDGSGQFNSVAEAINSLKAKNELKEKVTTIYIKNGVYKERVIVSDVGPVTLIGESRENVILTYNNYNKKKLEDGSQCRETDIPSTLVLSDNFTAKNITFENSSGVCGQAMALWIDADKAIVEDCKLLGWQDVLRAEGDHKRQYYLNCYISGSTDFIYGSATAIFENCYIYCKKTSHITAASTPEGAKYGYVLINCKIAGAPYLQDGKTSLGRPWRSYSCVAYINCWLGKHMSKDGWNNWRDPEREKTARYCEYNSMGPGANPNGRLAWTSQLNDEQMLEYTKENIFGNDFKI